MCIDWESNSTEILLNPRLSSGEKSRALSSLPALDCHIWLSTSGSSSGSEAKYAALSREALLTSARAVNEHLKIDFNDVWINPLPSFHVGGLGIFARSYLSGAKVISYEEKWCPHSYCESVLYNIGTLSSLVPTQVFDLVQARVQAPKSVRAVIVGGGQLSPKLYEQAKTLGWPLLPSYGMTEACSQIATAGLDSNDTALKILPHIDLKIGLDGFIRLKGKSLLTCYAIISENGFRIIDPKEDGWLTTEDMGRRSGEYLQIFGRGSDFVKIAGESVDMSRLERIFSEQKMKTNFTCDIALVAVPDERLGHAVHLAVAGKSGDELDTLISSYQEIVLPFERIRKIHYMDAIPRSPLQKVLRQKLIEKIMERQNLKLRG